MSIEKKKDFKLVQRRMRVGDKGRVSLSRHLPDATSVDVYQDPKGRILLVPKVDVPAHEVWLLNNPEALASVGRGLQQAKEKKFVDSPMKKSSWVDDLED